MIAQSAAALNSLGPPQFLPDRFRASNGTPWGVHTILCQHQMVFVHGPVKVEMSRSGMPVTSTREAVCRDENDRLYIGGYK